MIRHPERLHKRRTPSIFPADALAADRARGHSERLRHLAARLHRRGRTRRPQGRRRAGRRVARRRDELRHGGRSEEHTSELQSPDHLVCRLLLEKKKKKLTIEISTIIDIGLTAVV